MKRMSFQQFVIVQSDSAQHLTEKLNQKLFELRDKNPAVSFEGLIARISYYETADVPDAADGGNGRPELRIKCRDCPMFQPVLKRDGTADRRTTFGFCRFAEEGQTYATSGVCGKLIEMLNERTVKICFKDE